MQKTIKHTQSGFTLIEMMVAVALFSMVMTVSVSSLIVVMSASARAQAVQATTDNLSFAMDRMSREIRYAKYIRCGSEDLSSAASTVVADCAGGEGSIVFTNTIGGNARTAYKYSNQTNGLQKKVAGDSDWSDIIATSSVQMDKVSFYVTGNTTGDKLQPQVRILFRATPKGYASDIAGVNLQTTVTQRALDY